jgi:oligopeptidase B
MDEGATAPDRLLAMGGSAGGLLMGAVANMRPDLFRVIVANVPFVDVLRTMLDPSLPLTTGEYVEWGNPSEPAYYDYIKSYSPYDNVTAQDYPSLLITAGIDDDQVPYWQPAKWTAKLRYLKTDDNLLLLRMNMGAGHGGASGRYDYWREVAHDYAAMLLMLDMADAESLVPPAMATPVADRRATPSRAGNPLAGPVAALPTMAAPGTALTSSSLALRHRAVRER